MVISQCKKRLLWLFGLGLILFSAWSHFLPAKEKKKEAAETSGPTFQVNVNLVSVNVNVTDKHGAPISDLTEKDFQILDNGAPQKISVFRVEVIPGNIVSAPNAGANSPTPPTPTTISRKIILFVDDYDTDFASLFYVRKAGEEFVRTGLAPTDLVALITASGRHSTELTMDREFVIANLKQIMPFFIGRQRTTRCPPETEDQAILIDQNRLPDDEMQRLIRATLACMGLPESMAFLARSMVESAASQLTTQSADEARRILYSVQNLVRRLQAIEGSKELILLSEGFYTAELIYELNRTIDGAIRANTVIDSINAGGLIPDISLTSNSVYSSRARFLLEDSLSALATETGGKLYHNSNDLSALMKAAIRRSSVNYILGFYSSDERHNGQFHKLVVKVDRPGVSVSTRKGYFAPKGEESFEAMNSETIRDALEDTKELKGVPVDLSFNITHEETPESLVEVRTRIDVKKIHFRKEENKNQDIFSMVTIVYDSNHQFVDGREARLDFNLTGPHYQGILKAGLVWAARFKLPSGHYTVKTVVRETGENKIGSAVKPLEILD